MKDVGPVRVYKNAGAVVSIVSVSADVRALIDEKHLASGIRRQPLGHYGARESGADNEVVEHISPLRTLFSPNGACSLSAYDVQEIDVRRRRGEDCVQV